MSNGRRGQNLEKEIKHLQTNSIHKNLSKLQECLCKLYMNEFNWQSEIEKKLKSIGCEWQADESTFCLSILSVNLRSNRLIFDWFVSAFGTAIEKVSEKLKEIDQQKAQYEAKIKEIESIHAERMQLELEKHTNTFKATIAEQEVTSKRTYESQIATIMKSHEEFINLLKETHESESAQAKSVRLSGSRARAQTAIVLHGQAI